MLTADEHGRHMQEPLVSIIDVVFICLSWFMNTMTFFTSHFVVFNLWELTVLQFGKDCTD